MYIWIQNDMKMKNSQLYKGSLNTIIHEIAGGKRQDVRL
jgi:hypothetical protein